MKEIILCAAVHIQDGEKHVHQPINIHSGFVVAGRRHHNCYMTLAIMSPNDYWWKNIPEVQGFITSNNRFVNRNEAANIALRSGQISWEQKKVDWDKVELISEDLY